MDENSMNSGAITVAWHTHPAELPAAAWELPGAHAAWLSLSLLAPLQDGAVDFVQSCHYAAAHAADAEEQDTGSSVVGLLVAFLLEATDEQVLGREPLRIFVLSDAMGMCRPPLITAGRCAAARERITLALIESAIARARGEHAEGVHVYWIGEGATELRALLERRGFLSMPEDLCAHVPLLAGELGTYPAALRGNYRSVIKRKRHQLTKLGLTLGSPAARPEPATLDLLYQKVAARKEEERWEIVESRFSRRFFERVSAHPAFRLITCVRPDGELFGYLLGMQSGDTFVSLAVGLDYERLVATGETGLAAAIFQVLHAETLARAQAEGARWAVLGISALAGKARVGALCERNFGLGLGLTERAWGVLRRAQEYRVAGDVLPACRPYAEEALGPISAESARRGIHLAETLEESATW